MNAENQTAQEQEELKQNEQPTKKEKKSKDAKRAETAETALCELEDKYKRTLAEYDNFRKRSQKERETLYSEVTMQTVKEFLPVYDNLERAVAQENNEGAALILKQFGTIFEKYGIKAFGEPGDTFDPNLHSAVMHTEDENLPENSIAEVLQKGYMMGERVVRPAIVKAAN